VADGLLAIFEGEMSFPRKRESSGEDVGEVQKMDPRLRGDDRIGAGRGDDKMGAGMTKRFGDYLKGTGMTE